MRNTWIPQPRKGVPLLLITEYSGINKGQRVSERSKTAHRKPLVKCFLTAPKYFISDSFADNEGYSIASKGFLTTVVDIMVLIKFFHSHQF